MCRCPGEVVSTQLGLAAVSFARGPAHREHTESTQMSGKSADKEKKTSMRGVEGPRRRESFLFYKEDIWLDVGGAARCDKQIGSLAPDMAPRRPKGGPQRWLSGQAQAWPSGFLCSLPSNCQLLRKKKKGTRLHGDPPSEDSLAGRRCTGSGPWHRLHPKNVLATGAK